MPLTFSDRALVLSPVLAALGAAVVLSAPHVALAAQPAENAAAAAADEDDVPPNAPKDDYRFVAWCYGALDEYLHIYDQVKPDLKAIDKLFGTPVKEDEPYHADVAEDRKALKRFGEAIEAAEKASLHPIAPEGAAAIQSGRDLWSAAKLQPSRKLADAWLFWGLPNRCDIVAKQLKVRATLMGQAFAIEAPKADAAPAADPPPAASAPVSEPPAAPDAPPAPSVTDPAPLRGPQEG